MRRFPEPAKLQIFKTCGCGSAIASSSVSTEWDKGNKVDEVLSIYNGDIAAHLKLPPVKLQCSMLAAEDATIKNAAADWKAKRMEAKEALAQTTQAA
jgi:NifU-like protein involved in Fe-S cluster formation